MSFDTSIRLARRERGWSQQALAERSGVSRPEISAIELGRLVPSTETALRLSAALECTVEELFALSSPPGDPGEATWAFPRQTSPGRFWEAQLGRRRLLFPVEPTSDGVLPHDGTYDGEKLRRRPWMDPNRTVVIAGCDPAVGLLASELSRNAGMRLIPLIRSSREALALLERGVVHAAGVHWSDDGETDANAAMVSERLGPGFRMLHMARWQEGLALSGTRSSHDSISAVVRSRVRWVAREEGSGARRCLDRLLSGVAARPRFRHIARDHRGVAQAIRSGWAEAGVAVRLAAEDAGLQFISVQEEDYELCYAEGLRRDAALTALRKVLRSAVAKKLFSELPGYAVQRMGEERAVG